MCKALRSSPAGRRKATIVMVTARGGNRPPAGPELGADDYICKPFNPREWRAKAVLRAGHAPASAPGGLRLDQSRLARPRPGPDRGGVPAAQGAERAAGPHLSREQLMDAMYRDERSLQPHGGQPVKKLRRRSRTRAEPDPLVRLTSTALKGSGASAQALGVGLQVAQRVAALGLQQISRAPPLHGLRHGRRRLAVVQRGGRPRAGAAPAPPGPSSSRESVPTRSG